MESLPEMAGSDERRLGRIGSNRLSLCKRQPFLIHNTLKKRRKTVPEAIGTGKGWKRNKKGSTLEIKFTRDFCGTDGIIDQTQ